MQSRTARFFERKFGIVDVSTSMGSSQENGAPPSSCLLDGSKRQLSERLRNITAAMGWIKGELEELKESDRALMDIFKQLQGDVGELSDICNDHAIRRIPSTPNSAKLTNSNFTDGLPALTPRGKPAPPTQPAAAPVQKRPVISVQKRPEVAVQKRPEVAVQKRPEVAVQKVPEVAVQKVSSKGSLRKGKPGSSLSSVTVGSGRSRESYKKAVSSTTLKEAAPMAPTGPTPCAVVVNGWVKEPMPLPPSARSNGRPKPPPVPKKPAKFKIEAKGHEETPKHEPTPIHHSPVHLKQSSSSGSGSLLSGSEMAPEKTEAERSSEDGKLKESSSLNKLAQSPSISRLQEEEASSNMSRNSSIDSGIQFASETENNGMGMGFADEIFSKFGLGL